MSDNCKLHTLSPDVTQLRSCVADGKSLLQKALEANHSLRKLGEVDVCIDEVVAEATGFTAACYGSKERNSMSDVRNDVWATQMGKPKVTTMPDLKVLPPKSLNKTYDARIFRRQYGSRLSSRNHQLWIQQSTAGHAMKHRGH